MGILTALYPAVWGLGQLATGPLSDRWGRKHLMTTGMLTQATALALIALGDTFTIWATAIVLLGVGTAMVYPTWRARAVGAIGSGIVVDIWGLRAAVGFAGVRGRVGGGGWRGRVWSIRVR